MNRVRYLYVIGTDAGPFKIGVTTKISGRLSTIQTGSHQKLAVHYSVVVPYASAYEIEKDAHNRLHQNRTHGEWFAVSSSEARTAVDDAIRSVEACLQNTESGSVGPSMGGDLSERYAELAKEIEKLIDDGKLPLSFANTASDIIGVPVRPRQHGLNISNSRA